MRSVRSACCFSTDITSRTPSCPAEGRRGRLLDGAACQVGAGRHRHHGGRVQARSATSFKPIRPSPSTRSAGTATPTTGGSSPPASLPVPRTKTSPWVRMASATWSSTGPLGAGRRRRPLVRTSLRGLSHPCGRPRGAVAGTGDRFVPRRHQHRMAAAQRLGRHARRLRSTPSGRHHVAARTRTGRTRRTSPLEP